MTEFQLGQNALDVCKVIIDHQSDISMVRLIAHEVGINWRQRYQTTSKKLEYMLDGFEHSQPIREQEYSRQEFSQLYLDKLYSLGENQVWSMFNFKLPCPGFMELVEYFKNTNRNIIYIKWTRYPLPNNIYIYSTTYKLEQIVEKNKKYYKKINIFTGSIGAEIVLRASPKTLLSINKMIFLSPVNKKRNIGNTKLLNIYSKADRFANFLRVLIWPSNLFKKYNNINETNITLNSLRHDDFYPNYIVNYKGTRKKLFKVVEDYYSHP